MRSEDIDITDRLESLLECTRMMHKQPLESERNVEGLTGAGINFLHAAEGETTASLNHIIEETLLVGTRRVHERRIDVQLDLDPAVSSFRLDVATVGRALANLVCEAIDHSPEGGLVHIETRRRDDRTILLLIRDHESAIRGEEPRLTPDVAAANVAIQDSTDLRLFIVMSMTDGCGPISFTSPPDGFGVIVSYAAKR